MFIIQLGDVGCQHLGRPGFSEKQPKRILKYTGESPLLPGHCKLFSDHLSVLLVLLPYLVVPGIWLASLVEQNKIQLCTATPYGDSVSKYLTSPRLKHLKGLYPCRSNLYKIEPLKITLKHINVVIYSTVSVLFCLSNYKGG